MAHGQWDRFRRNYKVDESKMGAMFARKILSKQLYVSCHSWCALTRLRLACCKHSGFDKDGNGKIDFEVGKDERIEMLHQFA